MSSTPLRRRAARAAAVSFAALVGAVAVVAPGAARAQSDGSFTLGGDARAFAMGGAGIALLQDRGGNRFNPASLTFESRPFSLNAPSFALRGNNFDAGKVTNLFQNGNTREATGVAQEFARATAENDADVGLNANASLRLGKFEVGALGIGAVRLLPNARLRQWSRESGDVNTLPTQYADSRLDLIGAGYYALPTVGVATTLPVAKTSPYNYGVGLRVKALNAFYTHYRADANAIAGVSQGGNPARAALAPEMNGEEYLSQTGVAADVGLLARPRDGQGLSYAVVAANLINPGFKFRGTDRDGNAFTYDIVKTTYSGGLGYTRKATTLAVDLVDITGATGKAQLRAGAEQRIGGFLALRGGYNSQGGVTYGANFFGFDVAFGKRVPLEVVRTINF